MSEKKAPEGWAPRAHRSDRAPEPIGPYSQSVSAGPLVFCSGQVGLRDGALVPGGVAAEAETALQNLLAVLEASGSGAAGILKTTIYLVDMADFATVNEVYGRLLAKDGSPPPARATVAVAGLPKGARVEIDAVALKLG
jgi:2-iminobutanoate/2-iminopropanoate deaminase